MSDLRQDPVSGDWIIVAAERNNRPLEAPKKSPRKPTPKNKCPFEDLEKSGNGPVILRYPASGDWRAVIVPNKYPAVLHKNVCAAEFYDGFYKMKSGVGRHEILITRDHEKNIAHLGLKDGLEVFVLLQERYRAFVLDECLEYASTFFNWGFEAGASIYHPHFQIISLPILPPDVAHSLYGSLRYFEKNKRCVHCDILKYELKLGARIVAEDENALAMAPFVSRSPYEVRIFPKKHRPFFEAMPENELQSVVVILQKVLRQMEKKLNDPDLNFFIHTAPIHNQEDYQYYHWHLEILPKITSIAGFELGTGVDVNVVNPDVAAKMLRI